MLDVLYKTQNYIIVNKNPDIIINSDDTSRMSLQQQLQQRFPDLVNKNLHFGFYFPHRLDYSTSGVMCIALNKTSCSAASFCFQKREVRKYYLALLRGHVSCTKLEINIPIGERVVTQGNAKVMITGGQHAKSACSKLLVLEKGLYDGYPATKVLIQPLTGRRHQLRVHCQAIGHTIVGDYTYSDKHDTGPPRMFLHSYRLVIPNCLELIDITSSDPFSPEEIRQWTPIESINVLDSEVFSLLTDMDGKVMRIEVKNKKTLVS